MISLVETRRYQWRSQFQADTKASSFCTLGGKQKLEATNMQYTQPISPILKISSQESAWKGHPYSSRLKEFQCSLFSSLLEIVRTMFFFIWYKQCVGKDSPSTFWTKIEYPSVYQKKILCTLASKKIDTFRCSKNQVQLSHLHKGQQPSLPIENIPRIEYNEKLLKQMNNIVTQMQQTTQTIALVQ